MTKVEKGIYDVVLPITKELGYFLYDVMFVKEGKEYYLRIFIDKESGIDLDDCEVVSNRVSDLLDELDPISTPYNLEVSSCGLERHLREIDHYRAALGKEVEINLFKPFDGLKQFVGVLSNIYDDNVIVLNNNGNDIELKIDDVSSAKILFNWEDLKDE